jgi:thioredoxin 1
MEKIQLTKENFEAEVLQSDIPVLVDFFADWCGPCKIMEPILDEFAKSHDDIKVGSLDVDQFPDVSSEYGVLGIPTFILFKEGKEVARETGAVGKEGLERMLA